MSELDDEMDMVLAMFPEECERDESEKHALRVHLPFRFALQITLPPTGYPEETYPQLYTTAGPNAQLVSVFSAELHRRMREQLPLGFPLVAQLIGLAQALADELKDERAREDAERQERQADAEEAIEQSLRDMQECGIEVWTGEAITDRRSKFAAHMARVRSPDDVACVLGFLRSQRSIACAAHPAIYAYRYTDERGVLQKNNDDDGEHGAAGRIAFLMDQLNVDGYLVVVTRWFGGILLGPDRFKHIMEVTKNILLTIPAREEEMARKAGKSAVKR